MYSGYEHNWAEVGEAHQILNNQLSTCSQQLRAISGGVAFKSRSARRGGEEGAPLVCLPVQVPPVTPNTKLGKSCLPSVKLFIVLQHVITLTHSMQGHSHTILYHYRV